MITGIVLSRSGLPELSVLSRVTRRIPGLSRFIAEPERNEYYEEVATPQLRAAATYVDDTFNATPVPPPMSAGSHKSFYMQIFVSGKYLQYFFQFLH